MRDVCIDLLASVALTLSRSQVKRCIMNLLVLAVLLLGIVSGCCHYRAYTACLQAGYPRVVDSMAITGPFYCQRVGAFGKDELIPAPR
jgi:hypothetical protein